MTGSRWESLVLLVAGPCRHRPLLHRDLDSGRGRSSRARPSCAPVRAIECPPAPAPLFIV